MATRTQRCAPQVHVRAEACTHTGNSIHTHTHACTHRAHAAHCCTRAHTRSISVVFVDRDGTEQAVQAPLGKNLLEVAHENEIDLEGGRSMTRFRRHVHARATGMWVPRQPCRLAAEVIQRLGPCTCVWPCALPAPPWGCVPAQARARAPSRARHATSSLRWVRVGVAACCGCAPADQRQPVAMAAGAVVVYSAATLAALS